MTTSNTTALYNKLIELFEASDEKAAKSFLAQHVKEFPEDIQKKIVFALFEDALESKADTDARVAEIQQEGLDAIKSIEDKENTFKDKQKVSKLRSLLGL